MAFFIQQLANALTVGAIYALIALGYTMVYGVLNLVNFAHSELFMLGAFISLAVITHLSGDSVGHVALLITVAAALLAFLGSSLTSVVIERFAYRPLRNYSRLAPMLSALACAIILQNAVMLVAGRQPRGYPSIFPSMSLDFGLFSVELRQAAVFIAAAVLLCALNLYVHKTRAGMRIRAVSESHAAARICGISVDRVITQVFFLGGGLGALGGVLYSSYYGVASFSMGFVVGLKAFTAAVLGGIGNINGAVIGGLLLGLLETFGAGILPQLTSGAIGAEYRDIFAFIVLIMVLIARPAGLFGRAVSEETMAARKDF